MKTIKFTYVDSVTGVSVATAPAKNGPVFPDVKGLEYLYALTYKYPTAVPEFIGTCDDDADLNISGVMQELTAEELAFDRKWEDEFLGTKIKRQRNALLADSDWTQLPDAPVDHEAWATYRQDLRDIPQQSGYPTAITWPTKPE